MEAKRKGAAETPAIPLNDTRPEVERVQRESIDWKQAAHFLGHNIANRPLNPVTVARYSKLMREGRWQFNPADALVVDRNGDLRNGQHRLAAVIDSETEQSFLVSYGSDPAAFFVMDVGNKRDGADILAIKGEANRHALAAALRWLAVDQKARERVAAGSNYRLAQTGRAPIENEDLLKMLDEHPLIRESVSVMGRMSPGRIVPPSIAIWLHYRCSQVDRTKSEAFFEAFGRGQGLRENTPELILRTWLLNNLASSRRATPESIAAAVVKAWNRYYRDQPMRAMHWDAGKEGFPCLEGEPRTDE